jgi:hypothetical protein
LDLAEECSKLRDEGFFFSYDQHGGGPSDIVQLLKKKDLIKGHFIEISWSEPNETQTKII